MKALRKLVSNWWFVSIATALLCAAVLALALPIFAAFARPLPMRLLLVLLVFAVWAGLAAWRVFSARRAADRIEKSLAQPADGEAQALSTRMSEALKALRTSSGGRRDYLYSRPWYVIIGPPGAGKTTAILNSGLRFPYSEAALKGVGGTRNLDFWFADEAVMVDTAGRYTSQDSNAERDQDGWRAFLGLLKRNRPLEPVNGVLVAIGLDEIAAGDLASIDAHANAVRRRIAELQQGLEITVPVYVIFTKADLIAGFGEFYDDLDVEGRRAVLGATFPWPVSRRLTPADYANAFDEVTQAAADRCAKRLEEDLDARRRGLILGFPPQLEAMRSRVVRFLDSAFPEDAKDELAPLRGFYLTSGVQQGTPLDRLLAGAATLYETPPPAAQTQGRAYFLNRLLQDVVFGEAGLAQASPVAKARRRAVLLGGATAIAVACALVLAAWTVSFLANRQFQDTLGADARATSQEIQTTGLDLVEVRGTDPDLEQSLSILRSLRDLPRGHGERAEGGPPLAMRFGLYQKGHSDRADQAYREALQRVMLPRILLRLERYLQDHPSDPLALYDPLKAYLMLGGQGPLDRAAIQAWVEADWAQNLYPGADRAGVRKELGQHLESLLDDPQLGRVWPDGAAPLDAGLVASARAVVQTMSLSDRAYAILKQKAAASGEPGWTAASVLAPGHARAFAGGEQVLALQVPYFFTREGFEKAYADAGQTIAKDLEKDLWVMGDDGDVTAIQSQLAAIRPGIAALYASDYIKAWEEVVASLTPADYLNDPAALGALTATPSPLKLVLLEVRRNTLLSAPDPAQAAKDKAGAAVKKGLLSKLRAPNALKKAAASAGGGGAAGDGAGGLIETHFKSTNDYAGDGAAAAPVDGLIAAIRQAGAAKTAADVAGGGAGGAVTQAALATALGEVASAAAGAPPLVQGFASSVSQTGQAAAATSASNAFGQTYEQQLAGACRSVTDGRYPFLGASQNDAPVSDLLRVFGMNGQFDAFTRDRLASLIETSGPVWRWRTDSPVSAAFHPASAEQFQKAAAIRDLLASGVTLKVDAATFGGAVTRADIAIGGIAHTFEAGQAGQRQLAWSPAGGLPSASVKLYTGDKEAGRYAFEGPWAAFRLFDAARKENAGPTSFKATFGEGAASVTFRITLPGEDNPFNRGGVWSFRCPPQL